MTKRSAEEIAADLQENFLDPQTGTVEEYISALAMCAATLYSINPVRRFTTEQIKQVAMAGVSAMADALIVLGNGGTLPDYQAQAEADLDHYKQRN